jgi:hypothetical protein
MLNLYVGDPYEVYMFAQASVQVTPDYASASAYVDPTLTIDPSVTGYSINYSPGLLTSATVPEPSTLSLLGVELAGLLLLVKRARRRRAA